MIKENKLNFFIILVLAAFIFLITFVNSSNKVKELAYNNQFVIENKKLSLCNSALSEEDLKIMQSTYYQLEPRDVYISADLSEIFCFGKIVDYWEVEENKLVLFYGTNNKVFNLISFTGNLFLLVCFLFLYFKKKLKPIFIFLSIGIFNFTLNEFFLYNFNFVNLLTNLELFVEFFSPIFLLTPFIVKRNNLFLVLIFYFLFLNYEFFPLFVISLFLTTKFNFIFNKLQENIFISLPVIFWIVKFLTSLNAKFQNIWEQMGQRAFSGTTRFWDFQLEFMMYKCNKYKNEIFQVRFEERFITCPDIIGYGPLRKIIYVSGDLWHTILIAVCIMIFLVLFQYRDVVKEYKNSYYLVTFIFLSPSLNLLINQMNTDIFFFVGLYWVLKYYEKYPVILGFVFFVFSLYKLHVLGIFVGLGVFFLLNKDFKNLKIVSIYTFLVPIVYYFDIITSEPLKIPGAPDTKIGYGLLQDAKNISYHSRKFINIDYKVIYLFLFLSVISIFLIFLKKREIKLNTSYIYSSRFYGLSFWFFLTVIYENHSYRLPLFFVMFLNIFLNSSFKIKFTTLYFLFSNPIFILNPLTLSELNHFWRMSLITNRISIYFFCAYLMYLVTLETLNRLDSNYDIKLLMNSRMEN